MNAAFEDELQQLFNALRAEVFRFVVISHNHPSVYAEIRGALSAHFGGKRKIHEFSFRDKSPADIRDAVLRLEKGILLLRDVEFLFRDEQADLCIYFNQRRDFFAKKPIAFVFFIERTTFRKIIQKLPDWWSLGSFDLEFLVEAEAVKDIQAVWELGDHSPYTNWTPGERDQEMARIERLIADTDPENIKLLGQLYAELGNILFYSAQYDTALNQYENSLPLVKKAGLIKTEGDLLNNISQIHDIKGDYDTALRYLEQSLAIRQQIGDRQGEGATLNNISQIHVAKGDYDTALRYLEQSLAITQQIGDRKGEGTTLNNFSRVHVAKGNYDTALHYLEQSLAITQQIGDRKGEGATLNNISQIHVAKGDYDTALRYLEQSLAITQQIGDRKGEGTTLNNISHIHKVKGDYDTALRYLEQSLAITQQIGDMAGVGTTLSNMGAMLYKQNRYEEAVPLLVHANQIFQKTGSPNVTVPESYLTAIIERIGEAKFQEILSKME